MTSVEPVERGDEALRALARARFRASTEVPAAFFEEEAERIALACRDLARVFHRGQRLLVVGDGAQWSDALHVSVEFVHPVIVGKPALPALALRAGDLAGLHALAEPGDALLALHAGGDTEAVRAALGLARERGMTTIALAADGAGLAAEHLFVVSSADAYVVQEVHEMLYHVLWELVHVFLDQPATLR